jgi:tetratricopeptide (TPR) repeat protein
MRSDVRPGHRDFLVACDHDRDGREAQAIPSYQQAIALGLSDDERKRALLGLGSSLRNVGRSADAVRVLTSAVSEYPDDAALAAFLGLALYSSGDARAAVVALLDVTIRHAPIGQYARALKLYRDALP